MTGCLLIFSTWCPKSDTIKAVYILRTVNRTTFLRRHQIKVFFLVSLWQAGHPPPELSPLPLRCVGLVLCGIALKGKAELPACLPGDGNSGEFLHILFSFSPGAPSPFPRALPENSVINELTVSTHITLPTPLNPPPHHDNLTYVGANFT